MFLLDAVSAIGPVCGFVSQYQIIRKQKSLGSFSIDVCAIILLSSIMRVFFWFAKGFNTSLLLQSIFLIIAMVHFYHYFQQKVGFTLRMQQIHIIQIIKILEVEQLRFILQIICFIVLVKFLLQYAAILTILTLIFVKFQIKQYGQVVGFFSLSIQALLGFPQMISNHKTKSVQGLSYAMIGSWVLGDAFKTFYFILQKQPSQFIMCGAVQLCVDFIIIGQIYMYKDKKYTNFIKVDSQDGKKQ